MDVHVELEGDEIVVNRPGTDFLLAYRKTPDRSNLAWPEAGWSLRPLHRRSTNSERTPFRQRSARRASWGGLSR